MLHIAVSVLNQAPRPQAAGREAASRVFSVFGLYYLCLSACQDFWYPLIKWPIMDRFQSLGYV